VCVCVSVCVSVCVCVALGAVTTNYPAKLSFFLMVCVVVCVGGWRGGGSLLQKSPSKNRLYSAKETYNFMAWGVGLSGLV